MPDELFNAQYAQIQAAYAARGIRTAIATDPETGAPLAIYADDRLVVRETRLEEVRGLFPPDTLQDAEVRTIPGLRVVRVVGRTAMEAYETVLGALGPGNADVDTIISVTPGGKCPATEPDVPNPGGAVVPPYPAVSAAGGAGVRVAVCDTGLLADAADHAWLQNVNGDLDPLGPNDPVTGLPTIPLYTSHGTTIAGIIRCTAPETQVFVSGDLQADLAGTALSSAIVLGLTDILAAGVDVISLSAGSPSFDDNSMLAFDLFIENNEERLADVVVVAAAGNESSSRPFWPAAYREPWMIAVGALGGDHQNLAWFSDFNPPGGQPWIDVFAPGEDLVNAFASGLYTYDWFPRAGSRQIFTGMTRWSGTSFSTPLVAGLLAVRMSASGETPWQARAALLAQAQAQAIPDVGPALFPR